MRTSPSASTVLGSSHQKASGDAAWRAPVAAPQIAGPRRARSRPLGRRPPEARSGGAVAAMLVIGGSLYVRLLPGHYEPPGRRRTGRIARFTGRAAAGAQPSWSAAS